MTDVACSRTPECLNSTLIRCAAATHASDKSAMGPMPAYEEMYSSMLPELVTTAATSLVAITQMYFRLDGIHKKRLLYAKDTKEVLVFGDVIEVKAGLELPGDKVTLISRLLLASPDDKGRHPVVVLSSKVAFESFTTIAEQVRPPPRHPSSAKPSYSPSRSCSSPVPAVESVMQCSRVLDGFCPLH
jgi:hypothetical protein